MNKTLKVYRTVLLIDDQSGRGEGAGTTIEFEKLMSKFVGNQLCRIAKFGCVHEPDFLNSLCDEFKSNKVYKLKAQSLVI